MDKMLIVVHFQAWGKDHVKYLLEDELHISYIYKRRVRNEMRCPTLFFYSIEYYGAESLRKEIFQMVNQERLKRGKFTMKVVSKRKEIQSILTV